MDLSVYFNVFVWWKLQLSLCYCVEYITRQCYYIVKVWWENDNNCIANSFLNPRVKEFLKSASIWHLAKLRTNNIVGLFWLTVYIKKLAFCGYLALQKKSCDYTKVYTSYNIDYHVRITQTKSYVCMLYMLYLYGRLLYKLREYGLIVRW